MNKNRFYPVLYKNGIFVTAKNGKTFLSANGIDWPNTHEGKIESLLGRIAELYEENERIEEKYTNAGFFDRLRYAITGRMK